MLENPYSKSSSLTIMQVNTGRGGPAHETALNLAYESQFDVICIQEPCINRDLSRKLTKRHPNYETFSPTQTWSQRPRVLTYVRKGLRAFQKPLNDTWSLSRDILAVQVSSCTIYNIYRPPNEPGNGPFISGLNTNPLAHPQSSSETSIRIMNSGTLAQRTALERRPLANGSPLTS